MRVSQSSSRSKTAKTNATSALLVLESIRKHVDGSAQGPGSFNFLPLVLDALHEGNGRRLWNMEARRQQGMLEGKVQAQEGGLLGIHLQEAASVSPGASCSRQGLRKMYHLDGQIAYMVTQYA